MSPVLSLLRTQGPIPFRDANNEPGVSAAIRPEIFREDNSKLEWQTGENAQETKTAHAFFLVKLH